MNKQLEKILGFFYAVDTYKNHHDIMKEGFAEQPNTHEIAYASLQVKTNIDFAVLLLNYRGSIF